MSAKLYVGNLSYNTTDAQLRELFEQAGHVISVTRSVDRVTKLLRNFAFVEMGTAVDAAKAIQMFHDYELDGCVLKVSEARARDTNRNLKDNFIQKGRHHGQDKNPRGGSRAGFGRGSGSRAR